MTKRYLLVVFAYIVMQTGLAILVSWLLIRYFAISGALNIGLSSIITFTIGLIAILLILRKDEDRGGGPPGKKATVPETIAWSLIGIFLVFATQTVAGLIEQQLLGIDQGSENTAQLVEVAQDFLPFILVVAILGPIIEELVFRKAIFGWIYVRTNFFVAALISSIIFAVIHFDFEHILVYAAMGFSFAFLYVKTKRIIVPIISHMAINSFVVIVQVVFAEQLAEIMEQYEQQSSFIQLFF
ncbi:CPBP family intramembrane metalloprotease [Bacillus clausii]|uniref:CPBP family intramembrane glutamic endopeptidase n=1 Tax=Shouchella clausii TaxID=79880 RepID=UPI00145A403C|nr:CPBP family intramembrane metalloprotease [Shouchella clausii]